MKLTKEQSEEIKINEKAFRDRGSGFVVKTIFSAYSLLIV